MGSCFSKQKGQPLGEKASTTRITSSEQRLGSKPPTTTNPSKSSVSTSSGHRLGSSSNTEAQNSREAAAKAAEERYNKLQKQGQDSQQKLKAMSKMLRQEKGL